MGEDPMERQAWLSGEAPVTRRNEERDIESQHTWAGTCIGRHRSGRLWHDVSALSDASKLAITPRSKSHLPETLRGLYVAGEPHDGSRPSTR